MGLIFRGLGSSNNFVGLYFHDIPTPNTYHMVGNFCGVQIFIDFMRSAYPQKIGYIIKSLE